MFVGDEAGLNYAEGPEHGPPLVCLHGVLRCWQDYVPLLPVLTCRWQVLAVDMRGHGKSQRTSGRYLVRDYMRDVFAFVRDAVDEPAVIYGHSLGAMVAAAVAAYLPDKVRAVIMEDPPFDTMGEEITQTQFFSLFNGIKGLLGRGLDVDETARELAEMLVGSADDPKWKRLGDVRDPVSLRFVAKCLTQVDPTVLKPIVEGQWLEDFHRNEILRRVKCPTLLLQADPEAGGMLPDKDAKQIADVMANCLLVKVLGCGHLIHWSRRETTIEMVSAFLESI